MSHKDNACPPPGFVAVSNYWESVWDFDNGGATSPPDPGVDIIGVLIQEVTRTEFGFECDPPGDIVCNLNVTYYERWLITETMGARDSFNVSSPPPETEFGANVTGEAKFIPLNANTVGLLNDVYNSPLWITNTKTQGLYPGLDGNNAPINDCSGGWIHSGTSPNSPVVPSSGTKTWANDFGGLALSLPAHYLSVTSLCCSSMPPPLSNHTCSPN